MQETSSVMYSAVVGPVRTPRSAGATSDKDVVIAARGTSLYGESRLAWTTGTIAQTRPMAAATLSRLRIALLGARTPVHNRCKSHIMTEPPTRLGRTYPQEIMVMKAVS